ncbi:MAG: peptide chain release factor N(5)-glutamine methyltransferase, partial [Rhodospirillaceae bacterium]|nr:peptide chain release factor N(5)-glutamine methyltransferase [Rhodospirillaceae bacterium]
MAFAPEQPDSRRIERLLEWGNRALALSSASPRLDAEVLLASVVGWPRSSVMAFGERTVPRGLTAEFRALIRRRAQGVPVAHLTGRREFYSLQLRVSSATLVPRPETELLVDWLTECTTPIDTARILDLGTGCGAIALAVKRQRPKARVVGVDSSEAALSVARDNGRRLGLEVEWVCSNWLDAMRGRRFDFIVSNPPYVERGDPHLRAGDLRHEPEAALDGGVDGLDAIREIAASAPGVLQRGGALLVEHGRAQAVAVG